MTIKVLVVDDQAMVRAGFSALLGGQPDLEVVGEAANGSEAVELAAEKAPDVILMDVRMPVLDGLAATRQILARATPGEPPRVIMLTTFDLDEYVYDALRAGASGFLLKHSSPDELAAAVRVVAAGDALLAPSITRRLVEDFARLQPVLRTTAVGLTPRDRCTPAGGAGAVQPGDRRNPGARGADGEDPCEPNPDQAGSSGPSPGCCLRLRVRCGQPGAASLSRPAPVSTRRTLRSGGRVRRLRRARTGVERQGGRGGRVGKAAGALPPVAGDN